MPHNRIIKKYSNRRLYDTKISKYVTLENLHQLIVQGESFIVQDAKTGKELTRAVLLQIIAEHENIGQPIFSAQLLTTVIRFYGDSLQGIIGNYLERSIQLFNDQQQQLRGHLGNLVGQTPWSLLNQITERNMELWKNLQNSVMNSLSLPSERPKAKHKPRNRTTK